MDRDIIVIWSNCDVTYVILNGLVVGSGIERGYEMGEVLISLFNNLEYSYNKPLVIDIYEDDVDFSEEELEMFYDRKEFYTEEELQILNDTEDVEKFISKIKENLQLEREE